MNARPPIIPPNPVCQHNVDFEECEDCNEEDPSRVLVPWMLILIAMVLVTWAVAMEFKR